MSSSLKARVPSTSQLLCCILMNEGKGDVRHWKRGRCLRGSQAQVLRRAELPAQETKEEWLDPHL